MGSEPIPSLVMRVFAAALPGIEVRLLDGERDAWPSVIFHA